jgi:hypothetical protein
VKVYDRFQGGLLLDELATVSGTAEYIGLHTVDLPAPFFLTPGDDFYVYVNLAAGGHPYDETSDVPVLLGASYRVIVESSSSPGQSYYWDAGAWNDLYAFENSANFCMKALVEVLPALVVEFPSGLPEDRLPPGPATTLQVQISDGYEGLVPGSGELHHRFDSHDPYTVASLTDLGGGLFEALLPNTAPGDEPEFYFSAQGDGGTGVTSPATAPTDVYSFDVCFSEVILADDCESDMGWTIENVSISAGAWERGVPNPTTGEQVAPLTDNPDGTGTQCYLTGNGPAGSYYADYDIDGGPTRLISPLLDLSGGDAQISAHAWYYSRDGDDPFEIDLSTDAGSSWTNVYSSYNSLSGWTRLAFDVSDHLTPTAQVMVRYCAQDQPNNDIVEAGLDDFEVEQYDFDPSFWADAYDVSAASGGNIDLFLDAGASNAGRPYLIVASFGGSSPGVNLGSVHVPINPDGLFDYALRRVGRPPFQEFIGLLDGQGQALADFNLSSAQIGSLAGETMTFAFVIWNPITFGSNAIDIEITP